MDYVILLLIAVFVQLLFYRTEVYPWIVKFLKIPVILLLLPIEALCYKLFGTTPGKLLFGIHVIHADGCRHTFRTGFARAFGAWRYGQGFGIPIYSIWRMWNSFRNYEFGENEWNKDSEVIYQPCGLRQAIAWVLIGLLLLGCIGGFVYHYDRALNYGRPITVQEFSENFNYYSKRSGTGGWIQMDEEGRFVQKINESIIIITGRLDPKVPDLEYHTKDGLLTGFSCVDAFTYRSQERILPERYQIAMISLLVSGEGEHGKGMDPFLKDFKQALQKQIAAGEYKLIYETDHAIVSWEMSAEGEFVIGYNGSNPVIVHQGDGDEGFATVRVSVIMKNRS